MKTFSVKTVQRTEFLNITDQVAKIVSESGVQEGIAVVFCPHTTAGITINENADPDVPRDISVILDRAFPWEGNYHHDEGNSAAHVKSSLVGPSLSLIIDKGKPVLGIWQNVYFAEFDGPRTRTVQVQVVGV